MTYDIIFFPVAQVNSAAYTRGASSSVILTFTSPLLPSLDLIFLVYWYPLWSCCSVRFLSAACLISYIADVKICWKKESADTPSVSYTVIMMLACASFILHRGGFPFFSVRLRSQIKSPQGTRPEAPGQVLLPVGTS